MKGFIRWQPVLSDIEGYDGIVAVSDCEEAEEYEYMLPIAPLDSLNFIADASELGYTEADEYTIFKIGLISGCENVYYEVGTFTATEDRRQLYCQVSIPADLEEQNCYRLIFYMETPSTVTAWNTVSTGSCEITPEGRQTGWQWVTQERTVGDYSKISIAVSNHLRYSASHESTKVLRYRDERNGWDYDYVSNATFFQQVRLHLTIAETKPITSTKEYRQTNGVYRRGNTFHDKAKILRTDYFDEPIHDALQVALFHSQAIIDQLSYFARGEYEVEHIESKITDDRYHPMWIASIELILQGYNQRNNQCALPVGGTKIFDDTFADSFE